MSMIRYLFVIPCSTLLISACGGGSGSGSSEPSEPIVNQSELSAEQPAVFIPPNDSASLQNALYTRYASADDFDVWQCARSGSSTPEFAFSLPVAGTLGEEQIGIEYALLTGGEAPFVWQALSSTELRTTSVDGGTNFVSSGYQFNSESSITYQINGVALNCMRVANTVAFGQTPATEVITPSNSSDLSVENARILAANRPVSVGTVTIFASTATPPFLVPEGHMAFTFPNGYSTYCVNWDITNEPPPAVGFDKCSWSAEADDYTDLEPFAVGATIDINLESTGGIGFNLGTTTAGVVWDGQLVMTSDGRISFASGSSANAGRYFLNGYTITIKWDDGTIQNTYIGILSRSGGSITSIFFDDVFFSVDR